MSRRPYYEPEHTEEVECDVVMELIDGELKEVQIRDPEGEQQIEQ